MKNLFYIILFFTVLALMVSATYRCAAQPGVIGNAKMTTRVLGSLQVDSVAELHNVLIDGERPLLRPDTANVNIVTEAELNAIAQPLSQQISTNTSTIAEHSMAIAGLQANPNLTGRTADANTVPAQTGVSYYVATEASNNYKFQTAEGLAIAVTTQDIAQYEVRLYQVTGSNYWRVVKAPGSSLSFVIDNTNLFDKTTIIADSVRISVGSGGLVYYLSSNNQTVADQTGIVPVTPGTVYTISGLAAVASPAQKVITYLNSSMQYVAGSPKVSISANTSYTTTAVPSGTAYIAFTVWDSRAVGTNPLDNIQVQVGSVASGYHAYKEPLYVSSAAGYPLQSSYLKQWSAGTYKADMIVMHNNELYRARTATSTMPGLSNDWQKWSRDTTVYARVTETIPAQNLFDKATMVYSPFRINSAGSILSTGMAGVDKIARIPVSPSTQYYIGNWAGATFNKTVRFEGAAQDFISIAAGSSSSTTASQFVLTTPVNAAYIVIQLNSSLTTQIDRTDSIQLIRGAAVKPYAAYQALASAADSKTLVSSYANNTILLTIPTLPDHVVDKEYVDSLVNRLKERATYTLDATFNFPYTIRSADGMYTSNFNWDTLKNNINGTVVYVDPTAGSNSNAGTQAAPLKSVHYAITSTTANIIYLKPGFYNHTEGLQNTTITRNIKLLVNGAGYAILSTATPAIYTADGTISNAYSYTHTGSNNPSCVVDSTNLDSYGNPTKLILATSATSVGTTPGSYYYDGTSKKLTIRLLDSRMPDSKVIALLDLRQLSIGSAAMVHADNIKFWGGGSKVSGASSQVSIAGTAQVVFDSCDFAYGMGYDMPSASGTSKTHFNRCNVFGGNGDGLNYEENAFGFEWYCRAERNGTASADNGSTGHGDAKIVRIGSSYLYAGSRCVQDIDNCRSYNLGLTAGYSVNSSQAFAGGATTGSSTVKAWYVQCTSVGPALGWLVNSGSINYIYGGNYTPYNTNINGTGQVLPMGKYIDVKIE